MPARKALPNKPRFDLVTNKAYDILIEMGFDRFPISPWAIIEQGPKPVQCLKWSEARDLLKSDDPFHLRETGAEARTLKMRDTGVYLMIYDDLTITYEERIRWTIMHELGHVYCKHLDDFEETALNRGGLDKNENHVLEVEAHFFASEMFVPTVIFGGRNRFNAGEIRLVCGISEEAAQKAHIRLRSHPIISLNLRALRLYRNFYSAMHHHVGKKLR